MKKFRTRKISRIVKKIKKHNILTQKLFINFQRHFVIFYDLIEHNYKIKDLGIGLGAFFKLQRAWVINFVYNYAL